ncbi:MAG: inorganic diphosphatase [Sandaracinaceae bacterium]
MRVIDTAPLRGPRHYVDGYPTRAADGAVHAVIEVPAGTRAKFEVDHDSGDLRWEIAQRRRRVIDFVGYPGNYGLIPSTLLAREDGGDGDPLDVLVLGDPAPRGALLRVRAVALLHLLDEGERDDKVVAVPFEAAGGPPALLDVRDLPELRARYPGALAIVETFFRSYDGAGSTEARGWSGRAEAEALIDLAASAHARRAP